jgi:peptide-methionine (S)-S-oxide reductase
MKTPQIKGENRGARWGGLTLVGVAVAGALAGCAQLSARTAPATSAQVVMAEPKPGPGEEEATISGGCFWSMEAMFSRLKGVKDVEPGYTGGKTTNPTYEDVCTETTGHAETIDIIYDPKVITYAQIMKVFYGVHDPTTLNRQGDDEGTSYRSAVWYHSPEQKAETEAAIRTYEQTHPGSHVVTEVAPFTKFWVAEAYHHHYFANNPDQGYCQAVVAPKVAKFKAHFPELLK